MSSSPPPAAIRVLLADDHKIVRTALRELLELEPDIAVICDVSDGQSALEKILELSPDIAFLDIRMLKISGIDVTRQVKQLRPAVRVICFSMHHEKKIMEAAFDAGAAGYLVKSDAAHELVRAVRTVMAGNPYRPLAE